MTGRQDDPNAVMMHAGKYAGGKALIVLGGQSAKAWDVIRDDEKPDVILGANGVNSMIEHLDYWMCIENMRRTAKMARMKDKRAIELMKMLKRIGAKVRISNWKNLPFMPNFERVVSVQRRGPFEADCVPSDFSFREYGNGYIKGALMKDTKAIGDLKLPVGTVALQLIHHAGILGCAEVHTIGLDLCFKGNSHHAYPYPAYEANRYFKPENFMQVNGLNTMSFWLESARYLLAIKPQMEKVGMSWTDHSKGLLDKL